MRDWWVCEEGHVSYVEGWQWCGVCAGMVLRMVEFECEKHGRGMVLYCGDPFVLYSAAESWFCGSCYKEWLAKTFPVKEKR